jgi:uncharacterized protein
MTFIKTQAYKWGCLVALSLLGVTSGAIAQSQTEPQQLPIVKLTAGMFVISAQLAQTSEQREIGLMFRKQMPYQEGMLFMFDRPGTQCFWMKNTLIPLSAAFISDDGSIVNVEDMAPMSEVSHCSKKPVRFVLEMNQGWFTKRGMGPGAKIKGAMFTAGG